MSEDTPETEATPTEASENKRQKFSHSHRKLFLLINPFAWLTFFFLSNYLNSLLLMFLSVFVMIYYIVLVIEQICLCVKHRGQLIELLIVTITVVISFNLIGHAMRAGAWCFFKQNQDSYMAYIEEVRPTLTENRQELDQPEDNSFNAYFISGSLKENDTIYIKFITLSAGYAGHRGYVYFTGDLDSLTASQQDNLSKVEKNWYMVSDS